MNVRRAVLAGIDRDALRKVQGGAIRRPLATHLIPPSLPGFAQAGGRAGRRLDFIGNPRGDMGVAARYFRAAGFASGRYEGSTPCSSRASTTPDEAHGASSRALAAADGLRRPHPLVTTETFFTKFCGTPALKVNACAGWSWFRDFPDGQTMLDPTFNGRAIQRRSTRTAPSSTCRRSTPRCRGPRR